MHQPLIPLLAAGIDWLEGLLPVVFVVIWIVSQVMNLFRGARQPEARPVQPRPVPPLRGGEGGGQGADAMHREIEEFLRRSLEGPKPPGSEQAAGPTKPPRRRQRRPAVEPPLPASGRRPAPIDRAPSGADIASHVATAFEHDLAHESPDTTALVPRQPAISPAAELAAALRAPGGLRQLLLMQEVLARPTHRW